MTGATPPGRSSPARAHRLPSRSQSVEGPPPLSRGARSPRLAPTAALDLSAPPAASHADAILDGWPPRAGRLGAYLHLPFCAERCAYCSFNTAPYAAAAMRRLLAALRAEIDRAARAPWAPAITIGSVFVGGGTPSLATADELAGVLDRLRERFAVDPAAEVTVECNPESVSGERLAGYRSAGVTRVSLGVQSLDDAVLRRLNRLHSAAEARAAFDVARDAGFDNVSADLIYGLPGLDCETWARTVRGLLDWEPEHVSTYALGLDEGSLWQATGVAGLPSEDAVAEQYWAAARLAAEAGYEHYEISNYARPGRRSAHNQLYWRAEEYLGLGPGACGFLGSVRYSNVKPVERYCALAEAGSAPIGSHEVLTARQRLAERLILGLRVADGVPTTWIDERIALERGRLPGVLREWKARDLLVEEAGRFHLSEAGFLLSDALFIELL